MKINSCKLIGHKVTFYDGPYPVCDRCGSHAGYDNYDFYMEWHYWPYRLYWWIKTIPQTYRDWKITRYGLPDDEIPF